MPTVVAVGLGPAGHAHLSAFVRELLEDATTARLRTRRHPAAEAFPELESFDAAYEAATDFESLYQGIADELVSLAAADPSGRVVYAVPGSPIVAERTVELLRKRTDVTLEIVPATSFVDLACAAVGIDPVGVGLRLGDALEQDGRLHGPGPLLLAQAHSPAVLADVALRAGGLGSEHLGAVVLHHLGLDDEQVVELPLGELGRFAAADHLTSVYLPALPDPGDAVDHLVDLMATLRERCPWDRVQTHASLSRYLVEESYEALDALEALAGALEGSDDHEVHARAQHAEEELGDLLFQVVFHAHLGEEAALFDLRSVAENVHAKLVARHPHVFGDAVATTPDAVAARWEDLKRDEKGRTSVLEGIPSALPALSYMAKLRRKALALGLAAPDRAGLKESLAAAVASLPTHDALLDDANVGRDPGATEAIGAALGALCDLARLVGVDPEQALRHRARALADEVRAAEAFPDPTSPDG